MMWAPSDFLRAVGQEDLAIYLVAAGDLDGARQNGGWAAALATNDAAALRAWLAQAPPDSPSRGERLPQRERLWLRGELAMLENRKEEAVADFREALRHWAGWAEALMLEDCLADGYRRLGRLDEAIVEYRRALDLYPGMGLARFHLAQCYRRKGRPELAAAEYRKFLQLWNQADEGLPEVAEARACLR